MRKGAVDRLRSPPQHHLPPPLVALAPQEEVAGGALSARLPRLRPPLHLHSGEVQRRGHAKYSRRCSCSSSRGMEIPASATILLCRTTILASIR
jgi:hypothetical protein